MITSQPFKESSLGVQIKAIKTCIQGQGRGAGDPYGSSRPAESRAVLGGEGQEQRPLGGGLSPLLPSSRSGGPIFPDPCIPQAATNDLLIGLRLAVLLSAS